MLLTGLSGSGGEGGGGGGAGGRGWRSCSNYLSEVLVDFDGILCILRLVCLKNLILIVSRTIHI